MRELWRKESAILYKHNRALKTGDADLILEWQEKYKKIQFATAYINSLQRLPASDRTAEECYKTYQKLGEYAEYLASPYLRKAKEYEQRLEFELENIVI